MVEFNATQPQTVQRNPQQPTSSGDATTSTAPSTGAPASSSAPAAADSPDTVEGQAAANKFTGQAQDQIPGIDKDTHQQVDGSLAEAGMAPPGIAYLAQTRQRTSGNPQMQALKDTFRDAMATGRGLDKIGDTVKDLGNSIGRDTNLNPWAIVVQALMEAAQGGRDDQAYQLQKLQLFGEMQKQMMEYSNVLTQKQKELDRAIGSGKDANTNAQIVFNEQKSFDNTSTLDKHGKLVATSTASGKSVSADGLEQDGNDNGKPNKDGVKEWTFKIPEDTRKNLTKDGPLSNLKNKKIRVAADDEKAARKSAAQQINNALKSSGKNNDSMISQTGLSAELQHFNQGLDQLNTKISQAQNAVQNNMQQEQQNYGGITSVLKTMYEGLAGITRNLM